MFAPNSPKRRLLNLFLLTVAVLSWMYARGSLPSFFDSSSSSSASSSSSPNTPSKVAQKAAALDRHYLSRLGAKGYLGQKVTDSQSMLHYSTTLVTGHRANESSRIQWMHDELDTVDKIIAYIVDDPNSLHPHLEKNHGREAAVYLSYIVDNYDNLDDITLFWHNDKKVWHNNFLLGADSVQTINRMDRENIMRKGYVNTRCDHWPGCPTWIRTNPSTAEHTMDPHRLEELFNKELFSSLFPGTTSFPPYFAGACCSQFAVSRDAIHSRPLEVYKRLRDWAVNFENDENSGRVFEFSWPFIFTGRGVICPSMEDCYCQTYNLCIEDPADVEELVQWNAFRTRREEIKWQVEFTEGAMEAAQQELERKGATDKEVVAVEKKFEPELDRLNEELEMFVNATWDARENIVHKWKLPPPPVGW